MLLSFIMCASNKRITFSTACLLVGATLEVISHQLNEWKVIKEEGGGMVGPLLWRVNVASLQPPVDDE